MRTTVVSVLVMLLLAASLACALRIQPIQGSKLKDLGAGDAPSFDWIFTNILDVNASLYQAHPGAVIHVYVTVEVTWDVYDFSGYSVSAFYGSNLIDAKVFYVLWSGHDVSTLDFTWNTSGLEPGSYQISAATSTGASYENGYVRILQTLTVPDDYPTIQAAITAASEGDTVFVETGTYEEYVNVTKSLSIRGENVQGTAVIGFEVHADNVTISGFTMNAGSYTGVEVSGFSHCNISDNIIFSDFYPIGLMHSTCNHVTDNRIQCIVYGSGITLIDCNDTIVSRNKLSFGEVGLHLMESYNNTLCGNDLSDFSIGIYIGGLFNDYHNLIYHNNLINNQESATDLTGGNLWDSGCEGNYWSDYVGSDSDGDGIGDSPYVIDGSNQDNYPLMYLYWNPADIDHDLDVDIFDVVRCSNAYGSTPSSPNWNPHCDIAEPYGVIDIFDIVMIASSYGEAYTP
jgi:nitrous oxidase accessory protein